MSATKTLNLQPKLIRRKKAGHIVNPEIGMCIRCGCDEDDIHIGGARCISVKKQKQQ